MTRSGATPADLRASGPTDTELIEEARTEPTYGPASDHDAAAYWANLARRLADALEQSRPRVVETVEELDALPENTVIREHMFDSIHQRGERNWWSIASAKVNPGKIPLPVTVLYTPDAAGVRK